MLTRTKLIAKLERRHRSLDAQLEGVQSGRILGEGEVAALKREKLKLKDEIMRLRTRTLH